MNRRVAIVGSRNFTRPDLVAEFVASLPAGTVVVSGGAPGVDSWAAHVAEVYGHPTTILNADWHTYGRSAGPVRNAYIVALCTDLYAFRVRQGKSNGTDDVIKKAKEAGKLRGVRYD